MRWLVGGLLALVFEQATGPTLTATAPCDQHTGLGLPNTTITLAQAVKTGPFRPAPARAGSASAAQPLEVPIPFCRVAATPSPSSDSDIKMELWMPPPNWNRKFQAVGNGAFNGSIAYPAMLAALGRGYATASTDT